jgi:hypothetical protein
MATVNQIMPLSGQPKRFSFHIETNVKTTRITARSVISRRLKALNVSSGCTRATCYWRASVSLLSVRLAAFWLLALWGLAISHAGSCPMILLPGGGSLFEITSFPSGSW